MTVRDRVFSAFEESFDLDDDTDTSSWSIKSSGLDISRPHDPVRARSKRNLIRC